MLQPLIGFLAFAIGIIAIAVAPVLAVWTIMQILKGLGLVVKGGAWAVRTVVTHVARFVHGTVVDSLQLVGHVLTGTVVALLAVVSVGTVRFRAARHYGGAFEDEITGALAALYRVGIGHPVRLLGLGALTDGLERRLPDLVAQAPRTARAGRARLVSASPGEALLRGETPTFDGYVVGDELKAGGSGARLFAATPTPERARELETRGIDVPSRVVIKAFALGYGSTIPQIVRESRSLEAAKSLGLIVEHALGEDAFHYVMPFVPGEDLDVVTRRLHAESSGIDGLRDEALTRTLGYARDLCDHLDRFHREGLWHKDVKPSNLMVAGDRLQVVDFGLVTPLESALTLTTHGTEFFRDPELVRRALEGKRVRDVDGVKFDVYSAGAVLYSMLENSFPAHGSLSSISKRAPEALKWIVRRAMADIEKRYPSAAAFGADLDVLLAARDPFAVRPADLPSVRGEEPPAPAAARASFERDTEEHDVRRFRAGGFEAEVLGLDRAKASFREARNRRRDARRRRAEERASLREARVEARRRARDERRAQRRGMARAFLSLLLFTGALFGGVTLMREARSVNAERYGHAYDSGAVRAVVAAHGQQHGVWTFPTRAEEALGALGRGARVLIAAETGGKVGSEAPRIAGALERLGLQPVGVARAGRSFVPDEEVELLAEALSEVSLAGRRPGEAAARLAAFARSRTDLDAVLWIQEASNGHLRLQVFEDRSPWDFRADLEGLAEEVEAACSSWTTATDACASELSGSGSCATSTCERAPCDEVQGSSSSCVRVQN